MAQFFLPALLLLLATQQAPTSQPAFKSSVTVVEVDVVATDKSGRPVRGLGKEDFEVFEDDQRVDIATFSAIDVAEAPRPSTIPPPDRSGSVFASNENPDDGRLILIVLDDIQTSFTAGRMETVKSIARRTVERLGPADVAGVMTTSGWLGGQAELTTDRARLMDAIGRFMPRGEHDLPAIASAPPSAPGSAALFEPDRRAISAMAGLSAAARALATIPHRRKGVLLISQGFPASLEQIIRNPRSAGGVSIREFMLTAQRNNVAVYTVDPCGLELDAGCNRASRQSLRTIAEATGGFAVTNTNAPEAGIERMLEENGSYYLVGYTSPAAAHDGKHHRIAVRTRVANVEIRAREGYDAPSKPSKAIAVTPLEALTRAVMQTSGLTMRVVAIPAPWSREPSATVIVGVELLTAVAARAGRVEFALAAIDQEGKTRARARFTTNFTGVGKTASTWTRTGSRIDLPPGTYQIRVAAAGDDKSQGSVFTDVSVPKFEAELGVGGLSLGMPSSVALTDADRLRTVLPLIPLATNEVAAGAAVAAQLPIRISSKAAATTPVTVTATLAHSDGTMVPLDRSDGAGRDYQSPAGRVYRVSLPQALGPGQYRIIVATTVGRASVSRELAFIVVPRQ